MSLQILASKQSQQPAGHSSPPSPRKRWKDRLLNWFPVYLLLGFLLLGWILFGDRFLPVREVKITNVITRKSDGPHPRHSQKMVQGNDRLIPIPAPRSSRHRVGSKRSPNRSVPPH